MKCAKCGNEFSVGIFCPECGFKNELQEVVENVNQEKFEANKNNETDAMTNMGINTSNQNNGTVSKYPTNSKEGKGLAIASLIMGILSILTIGAFIIPEILGIVFALVSRKGGEMRGIAKAGLVCSIVSIVLLLVVVIFL